MIEPIDTPVAYFAVPWGIFDIAPASLAVEALLEILDDLVFLAIAIDEHDGVSWVYFGRHGSNHHQRYEISHEQNGHGDPGCLVLVVILDGCEENGEEAGY